MNAFGLGKSDLFVPDWFLDELLMRLPWSFRCRPENPGGTQVAGGAVQRATVAWDFVI